MNSVKIFFFDDIQERDIRNMRRPASCPTDFMTSNKIVLRKNYDSEEFRERLILKTDRY